MLDFWLRNHLFFKLYRYPKKSQPDLSISFVLTLNSQNLKREAQLSLPFRSNALKEKERRIRNGKIVISCKKRITEIPDQLVIQFPLFFVVYQIKNVKIQHKRKSYKNSSDCIRKFKYKQNVKSLTKFQFGIFDHFLGSKFRITLNVLR